MDQNAQDIGKQSADQMASMGKSAGGRLARLAKSKAAKWMKKILLGFLKAMVTSIGKILLATIGPWGIAILIAVLCFLAVLESIPGADWFLQGGSRSAEMLGIDVEYENKFKQLAEESVKEVESYRADEDWRKEFKELIKPSWGIPAALARYQIMRADPSPSVGGAGSIPAYSPSFPTGENPLSSMIMVATAYGPDCPGCSGITATGINAKSKPTPRVIAVDPRVIPLHSRVELIVNGSSLGVFSAEDTGGAIKGNRIDILYPSQADARYFGRKTVTLNVLQWGGAFSGPVGTWTPSLGVGLELPDVNEMYQELKPRLTYKTIADDVERWKTVVRVCSPGGGCSEYISYRTETRPSHQVLDWVWTPYGDITVPSLKKYWTSPQLIGRKIVHPQTKEEIKGPHTEEEWRNNKGSTNSESYLHLWTICSEDGDGGGSSCTSEYYQFENTEVDDRSMPPYSINTDRLHDILVARGVKEVDVPIVYQWSAATDPSDKDAFFYAGQFKGANIRSRFTDYTNISTALDFEFSGEIKNGWAWPIQGNQTITSTFGARWGTFHYGVDLGGRAANGLPVVAAREGRVIRAEYSSSYGNVVYIAHDNGLQTRYAHMNSLSVTANQIVTAGTMIGTVGSTGDSTGPHLHFEVLKPGKKSAFLRARDMERAYDPMVFLGPLM
ncbi:peptidoglycan DD-metalloendopeptidase family protein [Ammoniphilus resinae]|uniref:3D (Asp-Asp-Asp) domain-containing protein n=1 Tax=Ammoniphilus resinae TaxID=861532 RepID=A0ABS4GP20_9BACL|nr:peptidoglycan DD-metalloendopeptidase family protein [Ammoniphilus resinae]MBP1932028.1 3D (Asp-Asp-Asp) domain-containing protein [Ammoniphilus resinae]